MRHRRFIATILFTFICLAAIWFSLVGSAQSRKEKDAGNVPSSAELSKQVPQLIRNAKAAGAAFERRELFQSGARSVADDAQLREVVSAGALPELNRAAVQRIMKENVEFLELPLPDGRGGTVELELVKVNIFAPGFSVKTSVPTGENLEESYGVHYRGIVKGDDHSLAAISVFKHEVMGFFSTEAAGNSVVGRLEGNNPTNRHIVYADKDLKVHSDFSCETKDTEASLPQSALQTPDEVLANCVRIYIEADYDLFLNKGSVANTVSYMTGVFNQSATIYTNDSIPTSLSEILVWNVQSPYAGSSTPSALLASFQANRNSFNGDLGHLVALRGNGGIAAGFDAFCNTNIDNRQCFSGIYASYSNVPVYSWTINVFTHEMGHLMGSRHTHACVWNGNNTAIDACGPTAGYGYEGSCSGAPLPVNGGTIMSYCHLVSSVGMNFNNGFGTQPRNVILNRFNASTCLNNCSAGCTYSLNSSGQSFTSAGGSSSFNVIAGGGCAWSATVNAPGFSPDASFSNSTPINIPTNGAATPYPSSIFVSGLPTSLPATPGNVKVTLNGFSHTFPDDVGVVLVGPTGAALLLQDGAGDGTDMTGITYTLSDTGAAQLPDTGAWGAGTYKPTAFYNDAFASPAPAGYNNPGPVLGGTATFSSTFGGTNPNGTWNLYVGDFFAGDSGAYTGGWSLELASGSGGSWINITSGSSGSGNGTVSYTVSPNSGPNPRSGTITVNNNLVYTVTQDGANNACGTSTPISNGQTLNGTLTNTDCLVLANYYTDNYSFSGQAGQQIVLSMNSGAVDAYMVFRDPNGTILIEDNNGGGGTNSRIPATSGSYTLPLTGTYIVEASTAVALQTGAYSISFSVGGGGTSRVRADFDGDAKTDVSVFRPSTGFWYVRNSSNNSFGYQQFGTNGDVITPGFFDNDSRTDISVFRPSTGYWYILNTATNTVSYQQFGQNGDRPLAGDYDGDGRSDICVYRPSNSTFYQLWSSNGSFHFQQWGQSGDVPVMGDYDGDLKTDFGIFRPSIGTFYILRSSNGTVIGQQFGQNGDRPIAGDFDGDVKTDFAVYRPTTGGWYILQSSNNAFRGVAWGTAGDIPSAGEYDGDGKWDVAVFRPSTGTFYILQSITNSLRADTFGTNGDVPIPSAFVP